MENTLSFLDFDNDKVLVYWFDQKDKLSDYYFRLMIVQFSDCWTSEAKIKFNLDFWCAANFARSSMGAVLPDGDKFIYRKKKLIKY